MYQKLVKLNDGIYAVVRVIIMILLCVMSLMVFAGVIFRFAKISLPWVEEFSIYCFSWLTYFGAAVVLRNDGHLGVTAFMNAVKNPGVKKVIVIIRQLIILVFVCIVVYYSTSMVQRFWQTGAVSINIPTVKMAYVFFQIPLNYAFYALFMIEKIWGTINGQKEVA